MKEFFQSLEVGGFVRDGQFLMLFMVALLLLYLTEEQKKREFRQFSLVMLLLLLCPPVMKALSIYQTRFYSADDLWVLLPVTPLLAYAFVMALTKMVGALTNQYGRWKKATTRKKESVFEIAVVFVLALVLFLCGTLELSKSMTPRATGVNGMPEEVYEVLAVIEIPEGESVTLLADDDVARFARIYSGDIKLPYGRNLYEQELGAYIYDGYGEEMQIMHDWVNGKLMEDTTLMSENSTSLEKQYTAYFDECAMARYDYVVLAADNMPTVQQTEYVLWAETTDYMIYKLQ